MSKGLYHFLLSTFSPTFSVVFDILIFFAFPESNVSYTSTSLQQLLSFTDSKSIKHSEGTFVFITDHNSHCLALHFLTCILCCSVMVFLTKFSLSLLLVSVIWTLETRQNYSASVNLLRVTAIFRSYKNKISDVTFLPNLLLAL